LKILLIARNFPPLVSGGSRRAAALYNGLRAAGADVSVIAPELPEATQGCVSPHPQPTPAGDHAGTPLRDVLREWVLVPDPDIRWARRTSAIALEWAHNNGTPDWVITSSPPESIHACGAALKKSLGCRWAADFRDNWIDFPLRANRHHPVRAQIERLWARHTLRTVDLLLAVNAGIRDEVIRFADGRPTHVLEQSAEPPTGAFTFAGAQRHAVHTGSFSHSDPSRRLTALLDTFALARALNPQLNLHLAGRLTDAEQSELDSSPLRTNITDHGIQDAESVRNLHAGADIGVVVAADQSPAIPGKLFEYAAADLPVAIIGGTGWPEDFGWDERDPAKVLAGDQPALNLPVPPTSTEIGQELMKLLQSTSD
jgi:glycosyltransferase involved in cell wall biosynthesis